MSTSAMVAYVNPTESTVHPFSFTRAACFGSMNRLEGYDDTDKMDVMEWHPDTVGSPNASRSRATTPRKAFNFINSFGMWKDLFHVTTINSVAASLRETPIDAIITGFMTMRDFQLRQNTFIFSDNSLDDKIEFALWCSGIYGSGRYGNSFLSLNTVEHGEGGVCRLDSTDDALGLYLLVYGTKEQFEGCWAQPVIGSHPSTRRGYIRDSSGHERRQHIVSSRPTWRSLSDWLKSWLATQPQHLTGKLGRLTIRRFYDGLSARLQNESGANYQRKAAIITEAFEELREMYE